MMPVVLWSDVLVWAVVALLIGYAFYARARPHLAAPWARVVQSPAGMAALVVLIAFIGVGLLDSLHYRAALPGKPGEKTAYAVEVQSALDWLLTDVRTKTERTYSEPFATHGLLRETVDLPGGKVAREFPRLRHGGAHLKDPAERGADVAARALGWAAAGLAVWLALALAIASGVGRRHGGLRAGVRAILANHTDAPWWAILATAAVLAVVAFPAFGLAPYYHVLGTDKVGQDVFYLALKSIRTALVIGGLTTLVTLPLGVFAGIAAGYFRGWVDDVIQYVYTTLNSIPSVLLIVAAVLVLQVYLEANAQFFKTAAERADVRLLALCLILGLTSWTSLARLLRGETLKLREMEYIQAAHAFGVAHMRVITRHILPNVMHIVLISMVMEFSGLVLAEAVLSYVGVGVDPTMVSFGTMINTARLEMAREPMVWWSLSAAFGFMFLLVLAANLFADAVRDAFDPRIAQVAAVRRLRVARGGR